MDTSLFLDLLAPFLIENERWEVRAMYCAENALAVRSFFLHPNNPHCIEFSLSPLFAILVVYVNHVYIVVPLHRTSVRLKHLTKVGV